MKQVGILLACAALAVPMICAQVVPALKADVPFEFYVGDAPMPAGTYTLDRIAVDFPRLLAMKSVSGDEQAAFIGTPRYTKVRDEGAFLIFYKYDNDHAFLKEIRCASIGASLNLAKSRTEREHVTSKVTPITLGPVRVVILARLK